MTAVGVQASGVFANHSDGVLVKDASNDYVVYKQIGTGFIVVTGDGNMFSDLAAWDTSGKHNRNLLMNILKLR